MNRVLLYTILLFAASCSTSDKISVQTQQELREVSFSVGSAVGSKTDLDPDGTTVRWSAGDEVSLWAVGETTSNEILTGDRFTLKYFSTTFDVAEFSANSSLLSNFSAMNSDETYTYKAVYPYTTNINGSEVTWELPSTQSGNYDGSIDLRVAEAVSGVAPLSEDATVECNLVFKSLLHQLRVTIPEEKNGLAAYSGGENITSLTLTMPFECVGDVTVDLDNLETTLSNGSDTITITFDEPIQAGDGTELILFILPKGDVSGDIEISATGSNGSQSYPVAIAISDMTFSTGKYSTVGATIGDPIVTTLDFNSIDYSQLGEEVTSLTITAPSGVVFTNGSNVASLDLSSGTELSYLASDSSNNLIIANGLSIKYESANAIVSGTRSGFTADMLKTTESNSISLTAPYLFFEDFSGLNESFSNYDSLAIGGTDSAVGKAGDTYLGTDEGLNNDGWTGQRIGGSKNTALRICARSELASTTSISKYEGRLDAPRLTALQKSGVPIRVSFKYKYDAEIKRTSGYNTTATITGYYNSGYTNTSNNDLLEAYYRENLLGSYNSADALTVTYESGKTFTDWKASSDHSATTSYTDIDNDGEIEITSASSSTRIAWYVYHSTSVSKSNNYIYSFTGNGNVWLYIDEIRVSIDHTIQ